MLLQKDKSYSLSLPFPKEPFSAGAAAREGSKAHRVNPSSVLSRGEPGATGRCDTLVAVPASNYDRLLALCLALAAAALGVD